MATKNTPWHETLTGRACGLADSVADALYVRRSRLSLAARYSANAVLGCGVLSAGYASAVLGYGFFAQKELFMRKLDKISDTYLSPPVLGLYCGAIVLSLALTGADMLLPRPLSGLPGEALLPMEQRRKFASFADWRQASPLAGGNQQAIINYNLWATTSASQMKP
ncbi:hypothetical protein FACS1894186_3510 [Alphaproteobacteria bacterium]|nr:hypothetical protein FACS1894186_3510 [Alphaproteobacteria bacterium]